MIAKDEQGRSTPSKGNALRLARALDLKVLDLVGGDCESGTITEAGILPDMHLKTWFQYARGGDATPAEYSNESDRPAKLVAKGDSITPGIALEARLARIQLKARIDRMSDERILDFVRSNSTPAPEISSEAEFISEIDRTIEYFKAFDRNP